MPVVTAGTYDTAEYILNLTRTIINDSAQGLAGNLLADSQPYTLTYLNAAYRELQDELNDRGVETFSKETILANLTPVAVLDPAVQVYVNFTQYFDGTNFNQNPVLPADMVMPLRMWERPTGTTQLFQPMFPTNDGLPNRVQSAWLSQWEWKNDAIFMVGATQAKDLRLRYMCYLPDIAAVSDPVMVLRCDRALAFLTAAAFASARGSPLADSLHQKGMDCVSTMANRTARKQQRGNHRRIPYSRRGTQGWGWW